MLPDFGDRVSFPDFVNEALTIWAQHPWSYLSGRRFDVAVPEGSSSVELPDHIIQVKRVWHVDDPRRPLAIIDPTEFEMVVDSPGLMRRCTVRDLPSAKSDIRGELVPWLVLPEDHSYGTGFRLVADTAPKRIVHPEDVIDVPFRLEAAMLGFMRAIARGRFDEDAGSVEAQLEGFMASATWRGAVRKDATMDQSFDPGLGTAGRVMRMRALDIDEDLRIPY